MINDFSLSNKAFLFGKINNIRVRHSRQDFYDKPLLVVSDVFEHPVQFFESLTIPQLKVLDYLLYWHSTDQTIYMRQDTIAKFCGITREYANKILLFFMKHGIIDSNYRHMKTCLYRVSEFFNDFQIRNKLRGILRSLRFFPKALLQGEFTQYLSNIYKNSNSYHVVDAVLLNARVREEKKEREAMIADFVEEIASPQLTYNQKITLSGCHPDSVRAAFRDLQLQKDVYSPAAYLVAHALKHDRNRKPLYSQPPFKKAASNNRRYERPENKPAREVRDAAYWTPERRREHIAKGQAQWEEVKRMRNEEARAADKQLPFRSIGEILDQMKP